VVDGMGSELATPATGDIELVSLLQALADPVRLHLVAVLDDADGEVSCSEIALPVTKSTASHHYKVLREAGVIEARVDGTRRYYRVRRADLDARFPGLLDSVLRGAEREVS
jgi:DNA-binding transcriptional ArsR family regulator